MARRGATASRLDLLQEVWGHSAAVVTRTVDTHIAELRRKLEVHPAHPVHILTFERSGIGWPAGHQQPIRRLATVAPSGSWCAGLETNAGSLRTIS